MKLSINPKRIGSPRQTITTIWLIGLFSLVSVFASAQSGILSVWGSNTNGQLGNGTITNSNTPSALTSLSGITQVAGGGLHTLAIKSDGTVLAWGGNSYGQLGDKTNTERHTPVKVSGLSGIVQVAAGYNHSLAVKSDGTVWTWGNNDNGQLGDGSQNNRATAAQIPNFTGVVQVAGSAYHSLAVKGDGTVWAWGDNSTAELGDGTHNRRLSPVQVVGITGAVQASAGQNFSFALKSDGTLWAWGFNGYGQLGDGTTTDRTTAVQITALSGVVQVIANNSVQSGSRSSFAVLSDGTVWGWGANENGQLGDGTNTERHLPVMVLGLTNVVQVSRGGLYHSLALMADGTVWAWGTNQSGELGNGSNTDSNLAVQVSGLSSQTFVAAGAYQSFSLQTDPVNTKLTVPNVTYPFASVIKISATLKDTNGNALNAKTVQFSLDGVNVGTAQTNSSGTAKFIVPNPSLYAVGDHVVVSSFAGTGQYNPSSLNSKLTITKANTSITVPNFTIQPGQTKYLTATLRRAGDNALISGEELTFRIFYNILGTAITDGVGVASLSYTGNETLSIGAHTLFVEFDGDTNYNVFLNTGTLTVKQAPTKITASSVSGKAGTTVTLKAKVIRTTDKAALANRTLTFQIDGVTVGTATTDSTGVGTLSYSIPAGATVGKHPINVSFSEETFYLASSDGAANLTVK